MDVLGHQALNIQLKKNKQPRKIVLLFIWGVSCGTRAKHLVAVLWEIQFWFCCYMRWYGNHYLIMTTTHIQDVALGNTHAPSARYHDLAVGVEEQRLMSITSILGGYKCKSRLLSVSKGGIGRKNSLWRLGYYYSLRKMLILTINKHHPLMQAAFTNKQVIFMSRWELGLGLWFTGEPGNTI